ncbi:hypothetical protein KHQ81_10240 [Mycoplasmatota bacterium]|nr:hypothetical protein KHQ81_10240 [Mycoplasmatota bacterium]
MSKEKVVFNNEEIEEIDAYSEYIEEFNMKVDGNEVICFKVLSDLLHNRINYEDIGRNTLIKTYMQIKVSKSVFSQYAWFNSSSIQQIIPKINKYIKELIDKLKE